MQLPYCLVIIYPSRLCNLLNSRTWGTPLFKKVIFLPRKWAINPEGSRYIWFPKKSYGRGPGIIINVLLKWPHPQYWISLLVVLCCQFHWQSKFPGLNAFSFHLADKSNNRPLTFFPIYAQLLLHPENASVSLPKLNSPPSSLYSTNSTCPRISASRFHLPFPRSCCWVPPLDS